MKRIRKSCFGCKRAQAKAYSVPPPRILPTTRTAGEKAFEVIGVDFAGPLKYRTARKTFKKSYLALYTCSLTRGMYLELLPSLETDEFLRSFKAFVARRGRPKLVYSDNGGNLSWKELQDVILDVEVTLNNRPLDYVENDIQ